ncbi:MAG: hypothetical protein IJ566_02270 [Cardiobacteriaceae bacterium]|nr:hypothetical protein [Cardiobacteriaceae bacterium]
MSDDFVYVVDIKELNDAKFISQVELDINACIKEQFSKIEILKDITLYDLAYLSAILQYKKHFDTNKHIEIVEIIDKYINLELKDIIENITNINKILEKIAYKKSVSEEEKTQITESIFKLKNIKIEKSRWSIDDNRLVCLLKQTIKDGEKIKNSESVKSGLIVLCFIFFCVYIAFIGYSRYWLVGLMLACIIDVMLLLLYGISVLLNPNQEWKKIDAITRKLVCKS